MTRFLLRRLMWFGVTVWTVLTVSFVLMRATPGGPFSSERNLDPAVERNVEAHYHLDWSLWRQYAHYMGPLNLDQHGLFGSRERILGGVLTGDLGPSYAHRDLSVNDVIAQSFPISLTLGGLALLFAVALGIAAGVASALRPGGVLDHLLRVAATGGIALPNFVIAGILIWLLVFSLGLFPVAGWGSWRHMVLPALALGAPFAAYIARLSRTGLLEALSRPHVRTAVAKGLPGHKVLLRHAFREGMLPVLSYLGPAAAGVLTGSLVIEKIFFIPGTGTHFVNGALNRDYTLAMGVTLLYTVLVYALNTAVDLAYSMLDPRIDLERL